MTITSIIIFILSAFVIFWAMIGYPISLRILSKIIKPKIPQRNYSLKPTVTILVVAHNEEKVILKKLKNLELIDYPKDKLEIIVSSDNSTDQTNKIVKNYIQNNPQSQVKLFVVKKRLGKTNAQNEAQKIVKTEYLVLTDANSMLDKNSISELMASFTSSDIAYVCGKLVYTNGSNDTAALESGYWNMELQTRKIESDYQTIVAGNGALYAVRNKDYIDVGLLESHDSAFPYRFAKFKKRAIFNENAIVYEKAGENIEDEFKRKVRMRRRAFSTSIINLTLLNIFKYKWFTYFYLGHRYFRDILWLSHVLLLISNIYLALNNTIFMLILSMHILIYVIALFVHITRLNNKHIRFIYYYVITIIAQFVGVFNQITGRSKPFWDKAESTR